MALFANLPSFHQGSDDGIELLKRASDAHESRVQMAGW